MLVCPVVGCGLPLVEHPAKNVLHCANGHETTKADLYGGLTLKPRTRPVSPLGKKGSA